MNNRLDFISKFKDHEIAVAEMSEIRKLFMALDSMLQFLMKETSDAATLRVAAISRTHIESALHYAIKALCLRHEDKEQN